MRQTKLIMGMPITVMVDDSFSREMSQVFSYFRELDEQFSTYKQTSEIARVNQGLAASEWTTTMTEVLQKCAVTKQQTGGYFDIVTPDGSLDPSGLVKGWAIANAAADLRAAGCQSFYIEAGGDVQAQGRNPDGLPWRVGIRNPFNLNEIIKVLSIDNGAVATSGNYIRGQHIYNPRHSNNRVTEIVSVSVVGSDIYDADRFATAAFAMGRDGINFIANMPGIEGFMVDQNGVATFTERFGAYVANASH